MAARSPIERLMAAAGVASLKLPSLDGEENDYRARKEAREIRAELASLAREVHQTSPELAEALLADAAVGVADTYPDRREAIDAMDAARKLCVALRSKPSPPTAQKHELRWERRAGLLG